MIILSYLDVEKLNYPVFTCLVRNLTTKVNVNGRNVNKIDSDSLATYIWEGLCPVDPSDHNSELDPGITNCGKKRRFPLYECKNNCPGGRIQKLLDLS